MTNLLKTIILLGVIQGFIVSGLLFFSVKQRPANRLLAMLIFLLTLASFDIYGSLVNWFGVPLLSFVSQFLPLITVMPVGPLMYFYIRSFLDPSFVMGPKQRWQFLPIIIDLVSPLAAGIFVTGVLAGIIPNKPAPWIIFIDTYNVYSDIPRWISLAVYVWLSFKYLSAYQLNNKTAAGFRWLRHFTWLFTGFLVIWLLYLVPYVIPRYTEVMLDNFDWYPIYVPITILIYWLGIKGYIISWQHLVTDKRTETVLPAATVDPAVALLTKAMEEDRLYLNAALTLQMVARHTGIAPKTISAVLNQHLHKNFNEYVNEYRVALFKEKILQEEAGQLTITGVAYDCGFSSQATFQRVFRQFTGMSPSEYKRNAAHIRI